MPRTYLTVPYAQKDTAKSLGAKWDSIVNRWYVPETTDLAAFSPWLSSGLSSGAVATAMAAQKEPSTSVSLPTFPGTSLSAASTSVSLSRLLAGVATVVSEAYRAGIWTTVEVTEVRARGGHVYLDLSERDKSGTLIAKTTGTIWADTANRILPEFEKATGATLAPGIKLLVRAKPVFKPQYGMSVEIDAIDPDYTLGDLEARKREIRARLQAEGIFDAQKRLPSPWDFNHVLVVAPEGAAGLGDFQAESDRLTAFGLCKFVFVTIRFQGEGAAAEIVTALAATMDRWMENHDANPDAVVIIRGGGAVNDLAWLNDYAVGPAKSPHPA